MEALYGHSTPLNCTCPCLVQETDKNYFLLVIDVFDWQFLFDEQTQRRIGGTERWSVMWVTETPPGYHRL